jgi:PAS domain S-box-containing protein
LHLLFQSLIEQSADAMYVKDTDNRYQFINPAGAAMMRKTVEEVIGKRDSDLFSPEIAEERRARDRFIMRGKADRRTYEDADFLSGKRVVYQTAKSPLRSVDGQVLGVIGVTRDITEQKGREEECLRLIERLEATKRELEAERELRERIVANIGHDLRSPLTVAKMALQVVTTRNPSPELAQSLLLRTKNALGRVDYMIQNLLDSSKLSAGFEPEVQGTQSDLLELLGRVTQELSVLYPGRLHFQAAADTAKIPGLWDAYALQRVLENLVHNAVRHGNEGSPVTVEAGLGSGAYAWFSVHNFGPPIPPERRERLFERFQAGRRCGRSTLQPGWGLGLSIVQALVESHGGKVAFESDQATGTKFSVSLPSPGYEKTYLTRY